MLINMNHDNLVNLTGRIENDLNKTTFKNADGSRKIKMTLAVQNSYVKQGAKPGKQDISVEIFVPAANVKVDEQGNETMGIYSTFRTGDLVNVLAHLENNNYEKDGQMVYGGLVVRCDSIVHREPRKISDARAAARAGMNAAPAEPEIPEV